MVEPGPEHRRRPAVVLRRAQHDDGVGRLRSSCWLVTSTMASEVVYDHADGQQSERQRMADERFTDQTTPRVSGSDLADAFFLEDRRHGCERRRLAVDDEGAPDRPAEPAHPGPELVAVGVGRVAADGLDLGAARVLLAEDADELASLLDAAAEGVLGLEADEEDEVPVVADPVGQVVQDPARLRHAGRRDDHGGPVALVERLGRRPRRGRSGPAGSRTAWCRRRSCRSRWSNTSGWSRKTVVTSTASGLST